MNRNVLKILLILLTVSSLAACEKKPSRITKDTSYYGLKGPVKSVSHRFDYSNVPDAKDSFAKGKIELDFNADGKLTRALHQYKNLKKPDSSPDASQSYYIYDDNGRLFKQTNSYGSDSTQDLKYLYREGSLLPYAALIISEHDTQMHFYKHDDRGNLIEANSINKNFEHQSSYTAKFNSNNRPLEHNNSYGQDFRSSISFKYNDKGFVQIETESVNTDKSVLTYKYLKLDSYDNWLTRKVFTNEKDGYVIEKRDIIYY